VPAPPVLGTRERPCPFHPCRGPESRPAFCDGPGPAPPTAGPVGGNPRVRECRAGPGRPSVMGFSPFILIHRQNRFCHRKCSTPAGSARELKRRIVVGRTHARTQQVTLYIRWGNPVSVLVLVSEPGFEYQIWFQSSSY
jgi:hypothetical protein